MKRRDFIGAVGMAGVAAATDAAVVKRVLPETNMSFISDEMEFYRRSDWTVQEVKAWRMRGVGAVDRITIHHAGGGVERSEDAVDTVQSLQGILAAHSERGYGDIGYHLVVDYAGRIWEGRSIAYEGAHVQQQNERNIGVVLLGNFQHQLPSEKQIDSMKKLVNILREHYRIKKHRIYGHRDLGASACPGNNLYTFVTKLKKGTL